MNNTGIAILAAGNSSRLGTPKQGLLYKGKTLLQQTVDKAIEAGLSPVVVVLGSTAETISQNLSQQTIHTVINTHWQEGMASSIATGVSKIISLNAAIENIVLAVCDQPFLTAEILRMLVDKKVESGKAIVACSYGNTIGTPVLFHRSYFDKLLQLKGEEGAKKILRLHAHDVVIIPFPDGDIDIDTSEDYERLMDGQ